MIISWMDPFHSTWRIILREEYSSTHLNPTRSKRPLFAPWIIISPTLSQLGFQHNCLARRFSKKEDHSSVLFKYSQNALLRWALIKSSWSSPLISRGRHRVIWLNQISRRAKQHSKCLARVVFTMCRALNVSTNKAGTNIWPFSIWSLNSTNPSPLFYEFLETSHDPKQ